MASWLIVLLAGLGLVMMSGLLAEEDQPLSDWLIECLFLWVVAIWPAAIVAAVWG